MPFGTWGEPREILDHLLEGVQVVDREWRYVYLNPAAARQGRSTAEALLGRTMPECYPGIENTPLFEKMAACVASGRADRMLNAFEFPDGSTGWFELRMTPVPIGLMIMSIDVTDQRRIDARKQQSSRLEALGRMAGGVAHDFNNLLTAILAHVDFAELAGSSAELGGELQAVRSAALRAASLTQQLLTFARARPLTSERVDLADAVGEVSPSCAAPSAG
ncbi:MAG: PAS domain-containing protein [Myxococcota bacterium]